MSQNLETAAVKRFTSGYQKLCKNCPTRLLPRVDTLTEMIMGLPAEERGQLLAAVAQREAEEDASKEEQDMNSISGLCTPMEVYEFQLAGKTIPVDPATATATATTTTTTTTSLENEGLGKEEKDGTERKWKKEHKKRNKQKASNSKKNINNMKGRCEVKVMGKMRKARDKFQENEIKLARTDRLLKVVTLFLVADGEQIKQKSSQVCFSDSEQGSRRVLPSDDHVYDDQELEEVDEMRKMPRAELKLQRFKYLARKAKCGKTKAKYRAKRYEASLKLADVRAESAALASK